MAKLFDRVGQAVGTTGTGPIVLGGVLTSATQGDLATFLEMGAVAGDVVNYLIQQGNDWEIGTGALSGTGPGFTLTRTIVKSKIAGVVGTTALNLNGTAKIFSVPANSLSNTWANMLKLKAGGYGNAAIQFGDEGEVGLYANSEAVFFLMQGGVPFIAHKDGVQVVNTPVFFGTSGSGMDIRLGRDNAADTLALARLANAQTFRIYGSTDSNSVNTTPTNFSRLSIKHLGGTAGAEIATEAGGTGTAGPLTLRSAGTSAVFEQTGDQFGTTRLTLQNRSGLNGAIFENTSLALVDFAFKGSGGVQALFRNEQRPGSFKNSLNTSYEFQYGVMYAGENRAGVQSQWWWVNDSILTSLSSGNFQIEDNAGNLGTMKLKSIRFSNAAPASPIDGELWSDGTNLKYKLGGVESTVGSGGGFSGTYSSGTITADTPITFSQTWNNAAVAFTGFKINVTDTASTDTSKLFDVQVGGVSKVSVRRDGALVCGALVPGEGVLNTGFSYFPGLNINAFTLGSAIALGWGPFSNASQVNNPDVRLYRDAAAILGMRNSTNAQTFRIYGSTDSDSAPVNYSRLSIAHLGGTSGATIATEAGGTGAAGRLLLKGDGTTSLDMSSSDGVTLRYSTGTKVFVGGTQLQFWANGYEAFTINPDGQMVVRSQSGLTADLAIGRNAAGVLEINNGTAGTLRDLKIRNLEVTGTTTGVSGGGGFSGAYTGNSVFTGDMRVTGGFSLGAGTAGLFEAGFAGLGVNTGAGGLSFNNSAYLNFGYHGAHMAGEAAGVMALRSFNSNTQALSTPYTFRIYGSADTNGVGAQTNYSRLSMKHLGGTSGAVIGTEAGGTGSKGPMTITGDGSTTLVLDNNNGVTLGYSSTSKIFFGADVTITQNNVQSLLISNGGARWGLPSAAVLSWTQTGGANNTPDTALARSAAGIVEVNNGTVGAFAAIRAAAIENAQGTLTSASNVIAWDARAKQSAIHTLTENATLATPTNLVAGTTYVAVVKQAATGGPFTLAFSSIYKWPDDVIPSMPTMAGKRMVLTFLYDGTYMLGMSAKEFAA